MALNFFQRREILKNTDFLELIPVRIHEHTVDSDGKVTLIVPKFKNKKLAKFCIPGTKSETFKINLDKLGSSTWLQIDGNKKVKDICEVLQKELGKEIEPVEERLGKFMSILYDQRYITFKELISNK